MRVFFLCTAIALLQSGICAVSLAQTRVIRAIEYRQISQFETHLGISQMKISADGSWIVFSTGGSTKKVFTIHSDGTNLTQVYDFQSTGTAPHVDISANGEVIIWCDWVGDGEIYISQVDGSNLKRILTTLPNPDPYFADIKPWIQYPPRLTADGNQVYFVHNHANPLSTGVWRVNANGSGLEQVFDFVTMAKKAFDQDVSEKSWLRFVSGFDISADGTRIIVGTDNFKLEQGILDLGHVVVYAFGTFYPLGEFATGQEAFATCKEGDMFVIFRREYQADLGYDQLNVYFDTPGTGDPVLVVSGLDIFGHGVAVKMAGDGSRALVLGANGRLPLSMVDRISVSRLDLLNIDGISIHALGGYRFSNSSLPSFTWSGNRFCFLTTGTPPLFEVAPQIWVADMGSDAISAQPSITHVELNPHFVLIDGTSKTTFKAHVKSPPHSIPVVTFETFRNGVLYPRAIISDWPYWGLLLDNGMFGDEQANDGYFCNNSIRRDLTETPLGLYNIRIAAVDATLRHVSMVDAEPFFVWDQPTSVTYPHNQHPLFELAQNVPNPFSDKTIIVYTLHQQSFCDLRVFDLLGNELLVLVNTFLSPGRYHVQIDARFLPSGVYYYVLRAEDVVQAKKMLVVQ